MKIVSAYYDIPSKQPNTFYFEHIARFFKFIDIPILFFTDSKNLEILKPLANSNVQFQIQEFHELEIFKEFPPEFWQEQIKIDPEKYHTWQLGAIWANKPFFVKKAFELFPEEWYMWVDAGCVRTNSWKNILENFGKQPIILEPAVYVQSFYSIPNKLFFQYPDTYIAGSHILFHKKYMNTFVESYGETLKMYEKNRISLTSDQYIMASMIVQNCEFLKIILYDSSIYVPEPSFLFFARF
jgi:hypothetical protein